MGAGDGRSTCAATPSRGLLQACARRWPRPKSATTSTATTRRSTRCRNACADARQRGGAVRAQRHAGQPVRADGALRARRRIHRRPDGAHLPLGRRRRRGAGQHPAAAAGAAGRRHDPAGRHRAAIKPDDAHYARSRLLALENTWGGQVLPLRLHRRGHGAGAARGLATHLDGARLFNAAVATAQARAAMRATTRAPSPATSTASRSASARAWARRWVPRCAARGSSSRAPTAAARCSAAACGRPACSLPPRCMRWTTTSTAWPRTTPTPAPWPKGCRACPA